MPTQTIKWLPNTAPNIVAYEVLISDNGSQGTYTTLAQVLHMIPGSNWDNTGQYFFYEDNEVQQRFYRLATLDKFGNREEGDAPTPFQAGNDPVETPALHTLALDENTKSPNYLQYVSPGGSPISEARIRVYKKLDWDTQMLANAIGTTVTRADGGWEDPVFVQPGDTYTIVYSKANAFGPDTIEVTV